MIMFLVVLNHLGVNIEPGIILSMDSAIEKRRYIVTASLIDRSHTQNDICAIEVTVLIPHNMVIFYFR